MTLKKIKIQSQLLKYFIITKNIKKINTINKKIWNDIGKIQHFINIDNDPNYHIFFNYDYDNEIKQGYFINDEHNDITKINIKIDYQIKSLEKLFYN